MGKTNNKINRPTYKTYILYDIYAENQNKKFMLKYWHIINWLQIKLIADSYSSESDDEMMDSEKCCLCNEFQLNL